MSPPQRPLLAKEVQSDQSLTIAKHNSMPSISYDKRCEQSLVPNLTPMKTAQEKLSLATRLEAAFSYPYKALLLLRQAKL